MEGLKLKSFQATDYGCFENVSIDFINEFNDTNPIQWTVLMGNNNTGKTSLLKALAELRPVQFITPQEEVEKKCVPYYFYHNNSSKRFQKTTSIKILLSDNNDWWATGSEVRVRPQKALNSFLMIGYGVSRYPSSTSLTQNNANSCATLFKSDSRLVNLEEWLMQLDYADKNDQSKAGTRLYRIKELICGNLFPEIEDFIFESSDELHNHVLFKTKDGAFRYTELGYGYQSMLSWVVDLCKRLFDTYPEAENPLHGSAVVLVDEIDLHLHPKWQREIISYLSEAFPNVQFIVTTHSPLVVQSMQNINLYLLTRNEDGRVQVRKSDRNNYIGWTVEEILRDTMGLESDINSELYNKWVDEFNAGLDSEDVKKVNEAYEVLDRILHPNNPLRRMFKLQKDMLL